MEEIKYTVNVIYAGDRSSSLISDVPTTATVGRIKKMIQKINQMTNPDSIKIVQVGKILDDDVTIGSLQVSENQQIKLFVSGVPGKFKRFRAGIPAELRGNVQVRHGRSLGPKLAGAIMLVAIIGWVVALAYWAAQGEAIRFTRRSSMARYKLVKLGVVFAFCLALLIMLMSDGRGKDLATLFIKSASPYFDYESWKMEQEQH